MSLGVHLDKYFQKKKKKLEWVHQGEPDEICLEGTHFRTLFHKKKGLPGSEVLKMYSSTCENGLVLDGS